jgi:hypothetical protein
METQPHPQGTHFKPKTSGMAIASLVCGVLGLCLLLPSLFGGLFGIIALVKINKSQGALTGSGLAIGGLVTSALSLVTAGILASMLLPALARAKSKANRIKCLNNLGNINKAHLGFAQDNGGRYPWQLSGLQMQNHFGSNSDMAQTAGGVFGLTAMKRELQTPKILISPCDSGRMADNEMLQMDWSSYDTRAGNPVPDGGISYVLCEGADTMRPSTILGATRNLSSDDLATARWLGADSDEGDPNVMYGLNDGQGQLTTADGASRQSGPYDLGSSGDMVDQHSNSRGGLTKGPASTRIFR